LRGACSRSQEIIAIESIVNADVFVLEVLIESKLLVDYWVAARRPDGGGAFSLTSTCQRLGVGPWAYLQDVLTRLPATPAGQVGDLLLDRWPVTRQAKGVIQTASALKTPHERVEECADVPVCQEGAVYNHLQRQMLEKGTVENESNTQIRHSKAIYRAVYRGARMPSARPEGRVRVARSLLVFGLASGARGQ
jgi:hypothetical protein